MTPNRFKRAARDVATAFSLCQSDDPDEILLPNGGEDPRGDTLHWQFHRGDSDAPAFKPDGSFDPDFTGLLWTAAVLPRGCGMP